MKHIVVDARLYGPKHTGIGRYVKNLLLAISKNSGFSNYKFTLIVYEELLTEIKKDLGNKFNYYPVNISHYSFKEQLFLPFILYRLKPDLVHFTHFNKPILYFGKSVVTIHDLIKHFFKGKETTTKNPTIYWLKHFSYLVLVNIVIKTSRIIVPSNFWRQYLIEKFNVNPIKITTTYEAVDESFLKVSTTPLKPQNYIIYTGNLYPHKNIKIVLEALKDLPNIKLKLICARNYFMDKIKETINNSGLKTQVEFLGYLNDRDFKNVYSQALALVHPSLMEGFSLTGLEAMALNCPVISSDKSCLPEIYGDSVLYFDPENSDTLVKKIEALQKSSKLRKTLIEKGHLQVDKYSWDKTASQTLDVYQKALNET
jgi:glycosyltransferase involved in cell wall biosynthesis